MPTPATRFVESAGGVRLEYLSVGTGEPVTVFAHGPAGGIADTRPMGSGVLGVKIFAQLRGHGRSRAPKPGWSHADLAADLAAVASEAGATRALGVSLGAGALCRLVSRRPDRFERLVFFLPAVLDTPRSAAARRRLFEMADAVAAGSVDRLVSLLESELPPDARRTPDVQRMLAGRVETLLDGEGVAQALTDLADEAAVPDLSALRAVRAPALVLGCRGDDLHPAAVAERLAAALPKATLHLYDAPGPLWNQRADLRARVPGFLNQPLGL